MNPKLDTKANTVKFLYMYVLCVCKLNTSPHLKRKRINIFRCILAEYLSNLYILHFRSRISNSSLTETPDAPTMSDTDSFQLGNGLSMAIKDVKCVETLNEPVTEENDITIKEEHLYQEEELGTFEHFGCETCGDVFALKCDLEDHMKEVHMEGKLLSCSNCDKQFCEESELKLHAQIHVKGETFHNEVCIE